MEKIKDEKKNLNINIETKMLRYKITELMKTNEKLHKNNVKLEVKIIDYRSEIKALKKFIKDAGGNFVDHADLRAQGWDQVHEEPQSTGKEHPTTRKGKNFCAFAVCGNVVFNHFNYLSM